MFVSRFNWLAFARETREEKCSALSLLRLLFRLRVFSYQRLLHLPFASCPFRCLLISSRFMSFSVPWPPSASLASFFSLFLLNWQTVSRIIGERPISLSLSALFVFELRAHKFLIFLISEGCGSRAQHDHRSPSLRSPWYASLSLHCLCHDLSKF